MFKGVQSCTPSGDRSPLLTPSRRFKPASFVAETYFAQISSPIFDGATQGESSDPAEGGGHSLHRFPGECAWYPTSWPTLVMMGPPPFDEFVPRTQRSTRQLAARPWLRRPSPIPPLISRGAEQALASRTNAFRLNPSSLTDRPSTGLGPPWPVKTEKAIKPANAIADAFVPL